MNKKLFTPLFLAASFLVVGCSASEIVARPSWVDDPIVNGDVKDNSLKEIYDAIKKLGDTNSNVLNKVMYDIAQKQIGHFEDVLNDKGEVVEIGLKTIYNAEPGTIDDEIDAFVEKYPIYKSDEKTFVLDSAQEYKAIEKAITTPEEKRANSLSKIKAMYERIYENIFEKLFNEIKGGSYSTKIDKLFEEDYFLQYLYKEMYFKDYPEVVPSTLAEDRVFIPKTPDQKWSYYVNYKVVSEKKIGFLHVDEEEGKGKFTTYYEEYISRKLLPEIYRTLLIENYVKEQRSTNLGRSYARKVNMITVPYYTADTQTNRNIRQMLNSFVESKIDKDTPTTNFEEIKDAMVGFATTGSSAATWLTNFDPIKIDGKPLIWGIRTLDDGSKDPAKYDSGTLKETYVYRGTKLFDIVEKYLKIVDATYVAPASGQPTYLNFHFSKKANLTADEQAAYDDLTNNNAYTIEKGLELKERDIRLTDMTQDGWFLKSGGLTDLNEKFRNSLFNIKTSNIVDKQVLDDEPSSGDTVRYFGDKSRDAHGRYSSRKAYVFDPEKKGASSVVLDDGSANFYIVEVEEAASASKLSPTEVNESYLELKASTEFTDAYETTNEIVSKVAEKVSESDTYKKNAEQYYLMISNILFNDQSVYDYFKSQFPDLFK